MYKVAKRIIDLTISSIGLLLVLPLLVIISITLFVSFRSSILFIQKRTGKDAVLFSLIKFKTMNDNTNGDGNLLPDEMRLTKIGKFLRDYSLDELPQLFNVIKGDMSIVGPRPLLKKYLPLYDANQARRHEVRPGISGWAQVNGRNAISWQEKFDLDVYYVDNISFILDVKIFWLTIKKVIQRKDINSSNSATMEPFRGNYV